MSIFIKELVRKKLKQLSPEELFHYGKQYGFSLSQSEAREITTYLKAGSFDPFRAEDREKMFKELARITNVDTAKKARLLFNELIKSYGVDYLFTE
ncbi:DUF2624 domain-containing protein [Virgibacillus sp. NKC19-16]|uniref:DUF2624 domain-containing protein n=1 Tax=Virgibacillus salidurans TaxID=2831673 RepID=UPI001F29AA07|nr:DUF2624 domain-containing protein [Virgibacillus sp. NKC19-16]UJL44860.1 DUF2624 domain-containing protein [Virgibacillus sp. NKC19-16]